MASIPSTTFKNWQDGDIVNAEEYERELEIIRAAVNDNHARVSTLENAAGGSISRIPHGTAFPTLDIQPGQIFFRSDQELLYLLGTDMQWEPWSPKSALDAHILNDENPHEVSAAQVGAYTKTEVDNKLIDYPKSWNASGTNMGIQSYASGNISVVASGTTTTAVTFPKGFVSNPHVVGVLNGGGSLAGLTLRIEGITPTGCNIKIDNSTGSSPLAIVHLMAFGKIV